MNLKRKWVIKWDCDPKHTSFLTKNGERKPCMNKTEMFWKNLKQAVHVKKPTNMSEVKLFCTKKLAKISPS